jgi:hypothetical protein
MQVHRTVVAVSLGVLPLMLSVPAEAQYHLKNLVSNQVGQAPTEVAPIVWTGFSGFKWKNCSVVVVAVGM